MIDPESDRTSGSRSSRLGCLKPISLFFLTIGLATAALLFIHYLSEQSPHDPEMAGLSEESPAPVQSSLNAADDGAETTQQQTNLEQQQSLLPPQKNGHPDDLQQEQPDASLATLMPLPRAESVTCNKLAADLHLFFLELDHKPYFQAFNLTTTSQDYFISLVNKLLDNPPVVSRETDDLYTILTNMAHFFRILGKDNILMIKGILDREGDIIEDFGLSLYQWIMDGNCSDEVFPLKVSLEKIYEYAGFFLNTMGGRSYLFRRDSRSRLLVNYYAILIIDQVNKAELNRHGIHIPDFLPLLISEIEASNQLIYKELYLDQLYDLAETYQ